MTHILGVSPKSWEKRLCRHTQSTCGSETACPFAYLLTLETLSATYDKNKPKRYTFDNDLVTTNQKENQENQKSKKKPKRRGAIEDCRVEGKKRTFFPKKEESAKESRNDTNESKCQARKRGKTKAQLSRKTSKKGSFCSLWTFSIFSPKIRKS